MERLSSDAIILIVIPIQWDSGMIEWTVVERDICIGAARMFAGVMPFHLCAPRQRGEPIASKEARASLESKHSSHDKQ